VGNLELDHLSIKPDIWVMEEQYNSRIKREICKQQGIAYQAIKTADLEGFPILQSPAHLSGRKKVVVTGCFD
jgi:hypothetical protein